MLIDETYAYSSYNNHIDFYNIDTSIKIAEAIVTDVITCLWSNESYLFIGTTSSGVYYLNKVDIVDYDVSNYLTLYKQYPDIASNQIRYIHGNNECVTMCTESGIDFFKLEPNGYRSSCTIAGSYHCFLVTDRDLYYTVSGSGWEIYSVDPIVNWELGTLVKSTNDTNLSQVNQILTMVVASDPNKILFLATDAGVVVVDVALDSILYISD